MFHCFISGIVLLITENTIFKIESVKNGLKHFETVEKIKTKLVDIYCKLSQVLSGTSETSNENNTKSQWSQKLLF